MERERLFDTYGVEGGQAEVNDTYRLWIEAGYDLAVLELDQQRIELERELPDAEEQYRRGLWNLKQYELRTARFLSAEDRYFGDFEYRKEISDAEDRLKYVTKQLADLEMSIKQSIDTPAEQDKTPESWRCYACQKEQPDNYRKCQALKERALAYEAQSEHWKVAHDVARQKERALYQFLQSSTETTDIGLLNKLDYMKKRSQLTGPWYYWLYMIIIDKHLNIQLAAEFSVLPTEKKKVARRNYKWFWAATHNRLVNFRKSCERAAEANNREWKLPNDKHTLAVQTISYDDKMHSPVSINEDEAIEAIDERSSSFLKRVLRRVAKERANRVPKETSFVRRQRIQAQHTATIKWLEEEGS